MVIKCTKLESEKTNLKVGKKKKVNDIFFFLFDNKKANDLKGKSLNRNDLKINFARKQINEETIFLLMQESFISNLVISII